MPVRVVALGGGHGLAASLAALRRVTPDITAIVTVADDGGSSGRLRQEFGVLPPGDLRMALAALCGDDDWGMTWSRVVQHRFGGYGDRIAEEVPQSRDQQVAQRMPREMSKVRGQASIAVTPGRVRSISLLPVDPPAVPEAVSAILAADWVVFGPGSWFTSVLPHLLVPSLRAALAATPARRLVALNLVPQPGETAGFSPHRHLEVLADHAPSLSFDTVLADRRAASGAEGELEKAAGLLRASLVLCDVAAADGARHDPVRLAAAYRKVFGEWCPHGDDGRGEGRAQPDPGSETVLPQD